MPMLDLYAPELQEIREASLDRVMDLYSALIPVSLRPVEDTFWDEYSAKKKRIGLQACIILWLMTRGAKLPRKFQIQATMAALSGQDALLDVGTNAGKTLAMILPCLVSPGTMAVVVSPLKRLQAVQVLTYEEYKLKTVAINEDTLDDKELWKEIETGMFQVLIVQPEQLSSTGGHTARLARIINENRAFVKLIKRVHIDEAHFVYTAGLSHYGLPAFRSAWGGLGDFRIKIGRHIPRYGNYIVMRESGYGAPTPYPCSRRYGCPWASGKSRGVLALQK